MYQCSLLVLYCNDLCSFCMCSGFINHLSYLFTEVSQMCINVDNGDVKSALLVLALLLDTTHGALKSVSEVVRRALDVITLLLLTAV